MSTSARSRPLPSHDEGLSRGEKHHANPNRSQRTQTIHHHFGPFALNWSSRKSLELFECATWKLVAENSLLFVWC